MRPSHRLLATIQAKTPKPPKASTHRLKNTVSLEHFIQRTRVLSLYRNILRSLYRHMLPPQLHESVSHVKGEFMRNRNAREVERIRYLVSTGKAEWDGMRRGVEAMGVAKER
jgi:hypothetical protein